MARKVFDKTGSIPNMQYQVQINSTEAASGNDRRGYAKIDGLCVAKDDDISDGDNGNRKKLERILKPSLLLTRWEIGCVTRLRQRMLSQHKADLVNAR